MEFILLFIIAVIIRIAEIVLGADLIINTVRAFKEEEYHKFGIYIMVTTLLVSSFF